MVNIRDIEVGDTIVTLKKGTHEVAFIDHPRLLKQVNRIAIEWWADTSNITYTDGLKGYWYDLDTPGGTVAQVDLNDMRTIGPEHLIVALIKQDHGPTGYAKFISELESK